MIAMEEAIFQAILRALADGYLVELEQLPDGTIKARTVVKKKISIPTA